MRILLFSTLLCASSPALSEIYMCEDNGKKTFSQQPCGKNAQPVSTEKRHGTLALPEKMDGATAGKLCLLIIESWKHASQMAENGVYPIDARDRVFTYVREHISNFSERVKKDSSLFVSIREMTDKVTEAAYTQEKMEPREMNAAVIGCTDRLREVIESNQFGGQKPRGQKSP